MTINYLVDKDNYDIVIKSLIQALKHGRKFFQQNKSPKTTHLIENLILERLYCKDIKYATDIDIQVASAYLLGRMATPEL